MSFLAVGYPWFKALHIVAVVAWMAGLLYLPRLYVYHAAAPPRSHRSAMLASMERRLLRGIMVPALVMTYGFGGLLAATPGVVDWQLGWIWAKLGLVGLLTLFHLLLAHWRRQFVAAGAPHSPRFFRAINEIPTLLLIGIVILVVVKPF